MEQHQLNLSTPLAFFDLETTGTNILKDKIVQISILKALPGGSFKQRTWLVNPQMPIPAEASKVHQITDDQVADAPIFKEVAEEINIYIEGCDLGGFNVLRFDIPLLMAEFERAGYDLDLTERRLLDAQRLYHLMEPRTLTAAFQFYIGKSIEELSGHAHDAATDTLATFMVFNEQIKRYNGKVVLDEIGGKELIISNDMDIISRVTKGKSVDTANRLIYNADSVVCFNFGKYKDKPVADVFRKLDPSYYSWMMSGDFPTETKKWITKIWNENVKVNNPSGVPRQGV